MVQMIGWRSDQMLTVDTRGAWLVSQTKAVDESLLEPLQFPFNVGLVWKIQNILGLSLIGREDMDIHA